MTRERAEPPAAFIHRKGLERSQSVANGDQSPQSIRADELAELGLVRRSKRVASCVDGWWCRDRICPACAGRSAQRNARKARGAIVRFGYPVFLTLTLPSRGLRRLGEAVQELGRALAAFYRGAERRGWTVAAVAGIEPKLANQKRIFALHSHLVLDATELFDVGEARLFWRELTRGRGRLLVSSRGQAVESVAASARYITKCSDWCPPVGSLPPSILLALVRGIHGRRLFRTFGHARAAGAAAPQRTNRCKTRRHHLLRAHARCKMRADRERRRAVERDRDEQEDVGGDSAGDDATSEQKGTTVKEKKKPGRPARGTVQRTRSGLLQGIVTLPNRSRLRLPPFPRGPARPWLLS